MKFKQHNIYLIWNGKQEDIFDEFVQKGLIDPGYATVLRDIITEDFVCLLVDGKANIFTNFILKIRFRFAMNEKAADRMLKFYSCDDNLKIVDEFYLQQIEKEVGNVR